MTSIAREPLATSSTWLGPELLRERSDELPHPDPELAGARLIVVMQGIVDWVLLLRESPTPVVPTRDDALAHELAVGFGGGRDEHAIGEQAETKRKETASNRGLDGIN